MTSHMAFATGSVDAIDDEERELMRLRRIFIGKEDTAAGPGAKALRTVEAPSDGSDCPICLDNGAGTAVWKEMPCRHRFHEACLEKWLIKDKKKANCPVCRHMLIPPSELDDVYHQLRDIIQRNGKHLLGDNYHQWSAGECWWSVYQKVVGVDQCLRAAIGLVAEELPLLACEMHLSARARIELADAKLSDARRALSFARATAGHIPTCLTPQLDDGVQAARQRLQAAYDHLSTGYINFSSATRRLFTDVFPSRRNINEKRRAALGDLEVTLQEARAALEITSAGLAGDSLRHLRV